MKAINKSSHLKVIDWSTLFVKTNLKELQKKFVFGKIAVGKITPCIFNKKIPSQVPFSGKLTKKIVKFWRIFRCTKTVIVNVKHKFHLESR